MEKKNEEEKILKPVARSRQTIDPGQYHELDDMPVEGEENDFDEKKKEEKDKAERKQASEDD